MKYSIRKIKKTFPALFLVFYVAMPCFTAYTQTYANGSMLNSAFEITSVGNDGIVFPSSDKPEVPIDEES